MVPTFCAVSGFVGNCVILWSSWSWPGKMSLEHDTFVSCDAFWVLRFEWGYLLCERLCHSLWFRLEMGWVPLLMWESPLWDAPVASYTVFEFWSHGLKMLLRILLLWLAAMLDCAKLERTNTPSLPVMHFGFSVSSDASCLYFWGNYFTGCILLPNRLDSTA